MRFIRRHVLLLGLLILAGCGVNAAERNDAAISQYNQGNYDAALKDYQAAQVAAPDQAEPYLNAGSAYAQAGDLNKAIAVLQQALKTADDNLAAQAYYNLGNVYFNMHQFADAVKAYEQALLLRPDDNDARYNLELALKKIVALTPSPESQDATPTPDQGGGQQPTPSPRPSTDSAIMTPQDTNPDQNNSLTPTMSSTLTVTDAESLLDAVQQNQHTLQEYLATLPPDNTDKDW